MPVLKYALGAFLLASAPADQDMKLTGTNVLYCQDFFEVGRGSFLRINPRDKKVLSTIKELGGFITCKIRDVSEMRPLPPMPINDGDTLLLVILPAIDIETRETWYSWRLVDTRRP